MLRNASISSGCVHVGQLTEKECACMCVYGSREKRKKATTFQSDHNFAVCYQYQLHVAVLLTIRYGVCFHLFIVNKVECISLGASLGASILLVFYQLNALHLRLNTLKNI